VRISELAERAGVSIATIKFYLRDGLLPSGTATAPNRADYGEPHVHRLRLIRALRDIGDLDLARIRRITTAIDGGGLPAHAVFGVVQEALAPADPQTDVDGTADGEAAARADIDRFLDGLGWQVSPNAPGRRDLAECLVALRRLGRASGPEVFRRYAEAIDPLAAWEVSLIPSGEATSEAVERMAVGTVIFEQAIAALRRLAHEHHSGLRQARESGGAE
jgi:DNA-binding transcriptional MerR regulator